MYFWETVLLRNEAGAGNWLAVVNLNGPKGNAQAIDVAVALGISGAPQIQQVGQNFGAQFSQGHYRLYFGLGDNGVVPELEITWPCGVQQQLLNRGAEQLMEVHCTQPAQR